MTSLPDIDSIDIEHKSVFVRASLDVPLENGNIIDDTRLRLLLPTLQKLKEKKASRIIIAGHLGRPEGVFSEELSSKNLIEWFKQNLNEDVYFIPFINIGDLSESSKVFENEPHKFYLFENLRFWKEEEENNVEFAESLHAFSDVYVNDCFDTSHREHASFVGLPKLMPSAFGEHFLAEYNNLSKALTDPKRPLVTIFSGLKQDKLDYLDRFIEISDKVLVAGRLPEFLGEDYLNSKVVVAKLIQDKEDVTLNSIEKFESEIARAGTIIVSGPMGKFEEEGHRLGTQRVFQAVVDNKDAFKLAGGGDTNAAIDLLGIRDQFDWISTAGGAMLEFLANGTLPGIEVIIGD